MPNLPQAPLRGEQIPTPGPRRRSLLARAAGYLGGAGFAVWTAGQLLRDASWLSGLCFYLPSAVVAVLLWAVALTAAAGRNWRRAALWGLLACAPTWFVAVLENQWVVPLPAQVTAPRRRVLHWNVWNGRLGFDGIASSIAELDPDLCVLTEVPAAENLEKLRDRLGANRALLILGDLAFLARGELQLEATLERSQELQLELVRWTIEGESWTVLGADATSNLAVPRAPFLARIVTAMAQHRPNLALGDWNAPRRSLALTSLPAGYRHAYELAGAGWSSTWPMPCPLYAIDQMTCGPGVQALSYKLGFSIRSDHRWQILEAARTKG